MTQLNPPRRKNLRIPGYDYSQPGFYFVTICTKSRRCSLGRIHEFTVQLTTVGSIVQECWLALPSWFSNVALDEFIVMPNHVHGILELTQLAHSLRSVVGSFKSAATRQCRQNLLLSDQDLWQRGYFDHVVRSDASLLRLRQYIQDNPIQWHLDKLNPDNLVPRAMHGIAPTPLDPIESSEANLFVKMGMTDW